MFRGSRRVSFALRPSRFGEQLEKPLRADWPAIVVALCRAAAACPQEFELSRRLHSNGQHAQLQALGESDDRCDNRIILLGEPKTKDKNTNKKKHQKQKTLQIG